MSSPTSPSFPTFDASIAHEEPLSHDHVMALTMGADSDNLCMECSDPTDLFTHSLSNFHVCSSLPSVASAPSECGQLTPKPITDANDVANSETKN